MNSEKLDNVQAGASSATQPQSALAASDAPVKPSGHRWKTIKQYTDVLSDVAVIIGIILGAGWFLFQDQHRPKANISHSISHRELTADATLLHVGVTITNVGNLPLDLKLETIEVMRILPLHASLLETLTAGEPLIPQGRTTVDWRMDSEQHRYEQDPHLVIWPNESDTIYREFVVSNSVETIKVYSDFSAKKSPELVWRQESLYDLVDDTNGYGIEGCEKRNGNGSSE